MVKFVQKDASFKLWTFADYFITDLHKRVLKESEQFDFYKIQKDRTSRPNRIYMHQYDIDSFKECVSLFTSKYVKTEFSEVAGKDFTNCRTRIELCKDSVGSWLEEHTDDPAKLSSMQIFLTDSAISTSFDGESTRAKANSGWFFVNTGVEKHGLPPLKADRVSIIVNWVDANWKDSSVLI